MLADYVERQHNFDQSNPAACVAGQAKRMLIRENPLRLLNPGYWMPFATPVILWKAFGIPSDLARFIYTSGWPSRSGFRATRWQAALALRNLVTTGDFNWF